MVWFQVVQLQSEGAGSALKSFVVELESALPSVGQVMVMVRLMSSPQV